MVKEDRSQWKAKYFVKIENLISEFPKCFIVNVDNVGSKQMQMIRKSMRGEAELLMGKNTMIRKAINGYLKQNPALEKLLPHIYGNVGFVFTKGDLTEIRGKILKNRVEAPAKAGAIAPCEVVLPAQNTGIGPEKTSFFQALSIPTKITKGTIEILNDVKLIKENEKVGASEAALLNMLKISPFTYGLVIKQVYDSGTVFEPAILDITDDDLRKKFLEGVTNVASVSLAIGYPNVASVPHMLVHGFKNLLAIAAETNVTFKEAETMKEFLADPSKLAAAMAAAAPAPAAAPAGKKEPEKKEAPKKEEKPEEEEDMGFGLFD